jgi:CBS domain containing-hemolysin-like protein
LIKKLLNRPHHFFSTILLGNNLVNIAAATVATAVFTEVLVFRKELVLVYSTIITTGIILVFSEIIPKTLAMHYNEKLSRLYVGPLKFVYYLFLPFVSLLSFLSRSLTRSDVGQTVPLSHREIKHFLTTELSIFKYNSEVLEMLSQIIDLTQMDIKNFMIPRVNVVGIPVSLGTEKILKLINQKKHTHYPLYQKNLDNIKGIVETSELLMVLLQKEKSAPDLRKVSSPPLFFSEYSSLDYALRMFKDTKQRIAIIVDEYGITIGLITLWDILNEIAGFIKFEKEPIVGVTRNIFIVAGELPVFVVNERLDINLPDNRDYTTISGLFLYHYGKIPRPGSRINLPDVIITVKKMENRRIKTLKVEKT